MSPALGASVLRARVGLSPNKPQQDAGIRIDPPPSLACAIGTMRAATAAAEPPLDPPVVLSKSQGLWAGPNRCGSVVAVKPNSGVFVLATMIRPARFCLTTSSLSTLEIFSVRAFEPAV